MKMFSSLSISFETMSSKEKAFSTGNVDEPSSARKAAFSISEVVFLNLKLSLGIKVFLRVDLFLELEGLGESLVSTK
uniref:Uncharacterized protein n=1 Tax=Medicago truncatula TaxID=3880 RepID=I3S729_MEDTR|nr:unknown [Medicago truncatula]